MYYNYSGDNKEKKEIIMKKILIGLATGITILAPIAAVVSCHTESDTTVTHEETQIKALFNEMVSKKTTLSETEFKAVEILPFVKYDAAIENQLGLSRII